LWVCGVWVGVLLSPPPPPQSKIVVEVPTGGANKVGVFYCAVDSFGADGAAVMTTQAGEIINHERVPERLSLEIHAQCKCHKCNRFGHSKLSCGLRRV
jgi:hypothetical protein